MISIFKLRGVGKAQPANTHPALPRLRGRAGWVQIGTALRTFAHPTLRAVLVLLGLGAPAFAQPAPAAPPQRISIGYVEIENDPRYEPVRAYERLILKTR